MQNIALRQTPEINWRAIPSNLKANYNGRVSAVCRSKSECADLVNWFGDAQFAPFMPVLIYVPGHPQILDGQGWAGAAELRDQAVAIWEIITERLARTGSTVDFDALREKHGQMRREDVQAAMQEAAMENVRRHRANPVTAPAPQFDYPRVNGKTVYPVADPTTWRET